MSRIMERKMFYLAVIFIVLGLSCLLFYVASISTEKRRAGISTGVLRVPEVKPRNSDRFTRIKRNKILPEILEGDSEREKKNIVENGKERTTDPVVVAGGILFMNQGRYLPAFKGLSGDERGLASRLKRIGPGTMVLDNGGFTIRCGNASYNYSSAELDQILFQKSGVALLPVFTDRPVPVFLTDHPDKIKHFIKKYAVIQSY